MKVKINGERIVDVPQKAIKQGMEEFGLSEIDSARMYLDNQERTQGGRHQKAVADGLQGSA